MDTLKKDTRNFVERLGLLMEQMGASRTYGRQFALLMVAEEPLSLDEQAELLHVSKASVSTNGRLLERSGIVQRVSVLGDRRTYYEILPGSFHKALLSRQAAIQEMLRLVDQGLSAIDEDQHTARSRLEEMREFYVFVEETIKTAVLQWMDRQRKSPS